MKSYRQGDVLLIEVPTLPTGDHQDVPRDNGRVVLAYGEVTGHSHAIAEADARLVQFADGERYLLVGESVTVHHEEHDTVKLPPSTYQVVIQREYSPEAIRRVLD